MMSKNDDFWNLIAPIEKGDDETPGANNQNNATADLEKNLLDSNKRIDELEKLIESMKSTQETKEVETKVQEEENNENE